MTDKCFCDRLLFMGVEGTDFEDNASDTEDEIVDEYIGAFDIEFTGEGEN